MTSLEQDTIRHAVRAHYGAIAENPAAVGGSSCGCGTGSGSGSSCCGSDSSAAPTSAGEYGEKLGYTADELAAAPAGANLNLGCGNPTAIASIQPGETVLDLGSGAGFDAFLAARQLAGTGRVIGVDMTPAMVSKARANAARSGHTNVEFRLGEIEQLPVADGTVDLIISNCVINLSPDKPQVFREAHRVLKPGGRLAIADVVALAPLPDHVRNDLAAYGACVAGAALVNDVRAMLQAAGFTDIRITQKSDSRELISDWTTHGDAGDYVTSAVIEAVKR
jgi:SAM-dependent methyltransferase